MAFLLLERLHTDAEALLAEHAEVIIADDDASAHRIAERGDIQAIFTRGARRITLSLMQACGTSLRAVSRAGTGLDTVDLVAAQTLGIAVVYAPGLNARTTAEHALMLMLMAARKAAWLDAQVKSGNWHVRKGYQGVELYGKTLGILGLGNIGRQVACLAQAFGMTVVYWSPHTRDDRFTYLERDEVLRTADVISLHMQLTEDTQGMIGARELALLKPGAILVNTARGKLIDQSALVAALQHGHLGAFAADVLVEQPPDPSDPLLQLDRVTITPHVAGLTDRTYRDVSLFCARNVVALLRGDPVEPNSLYHP